MRNEVEAIATSHTHQLWLLNHPSVYTLGQAADRSHVLRVDESMLVQTDRGGQVTWHGPGQIILYTLLHLPSLGLGPKRLVKALEQAVIDCLAEHGCTGQRRPGAPGVYLNDAKIASVGLRIRKGVSYHGLSFNHSCDLAWFAGVNPCGYPGLQVTRLCDHTRLDEQQCALQLCVHLARLLHCQLVESLEQSTTISTFGAGLA